MTYCFHSDQYFIHNTITFYTYLKMSLCTCRYSKEKNKLICQVYTQISQDIIKGAYQTSNHFWFCVAKHTRIRKIQIGVNIQEDPSKLEFKLLKKEQKIFMYALENAKVSIQVVFQMMKI